MEVAGAGAALGATIKVVLEKLLSYPVEETGLLWYYKKDFKKLKGYVTTIQKLLEDAEMKQVMTDNSVAFEADYVFDQLNYQHLRKKVHRGTMKKVSSFFSTSNPVVLRHRMVRKIKNIQKELKLINQKATELGLQARIANGPARGARAQETDSFSMDPIFVGRENDVLKIVDMMTSNSSANQLVSVLPIVGMGGSGKTTLARKVYNDPAIITLFFN